jgi:hypothetical protein
VLFLFLGFLSAWIVPGIGCVGALGSILVLYGLITMFGTAGVFVWFAVLLALRRHAVRPAGPDPARAGRSVAIRSSPPRKGWRNDADSQLR